MVVKFPLTISCRFWIFSFWNFIFVPVKLLVMSNKLLKKSLNRVIHRITFAMHSRKWSKRHLNYLRDWFSVLTTNFQFFYIHSYQLLMFKFECICSLLSSNSMLRDMAIHHLHFYISKFPFPTINWPKSSFAFIIVNGTNMSLSYYTIITKSAAVTITQPLTKVQQVQKASSYFGCCYMLSDSHPSIKPDRIKTTC